MSRRGQLISYITLKILKEYDSYLPYHYNKEIERLGYANFRKKSSKYNLADLFTKPTPKGVNTRLSDYLCGYKLINPGIIEDDL